MVVRLPRYSILITWYSILHYMEQPTPKACIWRDPTFHVLQRLLGLALTSSPMELIRTGLTPNINIGPYSRRGVGKRGRRRGTGGCWSVGAGAKRPYEDIDGV